MKKILLSWMLMLAACWTLCAIPAVKGRILRTQPDGTTIATYLHGDEFGHWVTDEQDRMLTEGMDGFWKVSQAESPEAIIRQAGIRRNAVNRQRLAARSSNHTGSPRIPVILISFADREFSKSSGEFDAMLNQEGYSENQAVGSVLDYYKENSQGAFTPQFEVLGPVTVDQNMSYYGANDSRGQDLRPEMALVHAAKKLDGDVDFSRFDNDGDGVVDFVLFYFAGYDEAQGGGTRCIWSHAWSLSESRYARDSSVYDGVRIEDYFCTSELLGARGNTMCRIGTTCHEFAHTLGLPDFYDADYATNGNSANTYSTDLMADGAYNADSTTPPYLNAEELWEIGWLPDIPELTSGGPCSLGPVNHPAASGYSARKLPSARSGEYFLFEVRGGERWDAPIPQGLLVYHVDRSDRRIKSFRTAIQTWENNEVNNYSSHPCCYIVPASDPESTKVFKGTMAQLFFPLGGKATRYVPKDWDGRVPDWFLDGIAYADGRASWEMMDAWVMPETGYVTIANPGEGIYHAGDAFPLKLTEATGAAVPVGVRWSLDGEPVSGDAIVLTSGPHTIEASFTESSGRKKNLLLELDVR